MVTQTYQGKATSTNVQNVSPQRQSQKPCQRRSQIRNSIIAAAGSTTPIGPFASTPRPETAPRETNHHHGCFSWPSQKTKKASTVQRFNSESWLANRAAPQSIGVVAAMTLPSNPVVRENMLRPSS